ncbi:DUF6119 family protein [Dyadobacter sp. OTU695]|uniref:DUF6119 family protein n=1 Tax=Dyadobacter sp. OTU695 TaxID=3043860 RepID=UPI00313B2C33
MPSGIKPTVYLLKSEVGSPADVFKDSSRLRSKESHGVSLFYKNSPTHPPKWAPFLSDNFEVDQGNFKNASAYAAIVMKVDNRFFVIPLGMGVHLVDMTKIEYNFGLKIAINCIPKDEIRQMDLTTPEANSQKTKKQAVRSSTTEEFGVNKQKDILRGVVGKLPENHVFGERIEGKDSVRTSKTISSVEDLQNLCSRLLLESNKDSYKTDFPWIDNMAIINDPTVLENLYSDLVAAIKNNTTDNISLSAPEFVDNLYDYEGFVFTGNGKRRSGKDAYPFPTIENVIGEIGTEGINDLGRDALFKTHKVCLRDADGNYHFNWPLYRCLNWEIEKDGSKFILSEGHWYRIESNFYNQVTQYFNSHFQSNLGLPLVPADIKRESDYNAHACETNPDNFLFDLGHPSARTKFFGQDKNEFCDIFDSSGKRFVHVKPGKNSPDISHLLRQGVFSGRSLKLTPETASTLVQHLNDYGCAPGIISLPFSPNEYKVVFALILESNQRLDIPFFSKASFMDASQFSLEIIGYEVQFGYLIKDIPILAAEEEV